MHILDFILLSFAFVTSFDLLQAKELKAELYVESTNVTLNSTPSTIRCADYKKLRTSIEKDTAAYKTDRSFFEPEKNNGKSPTFIIFDKKSWTITVCYKGKVVSALYDGKRHEDSHIEIGKSYLVDMNNDDRIEFVLGDLQCVEGPCLGNFYLFQIDGARIRKINVIRTTLHDLKSTGKKNFLKLTKLCFTHEFGVAFEWFAVGSFAKNKTLIEHPFDDIRKQFPTLLVEYAAGIKGQEEGAKNFPSDKMNVAYTTISRLLLRAYKGEPAKILHAEYDALVKPYEKNGGLPIYCEPKTLISMITR